MHTIHAHPISEVLPDRHPPSTVANIRIIFDFSPDWEGGFSTELAGGPVPVPVPPPSIVSCSPPLVECLVAGGRHHLRQLLSATSGRRCGAGSSTSIPWRIVATCVALSGPRAGIA
ncbi:hypothetical protein SEVIR_3G378100v4 [Setaria viridis]|uniref:Uncharacterized protein n=1 Tax=Setaria viridis TaxID=4556 RepID=A0A4U6VN85_SETVI|nr:hypothetical protein SEVIR_3G378100v2 [Setaria viridis]